MKGAIELLLNSICEYDKVISNFNIELTRKCNLKCDFCARGTAQNLTTTKEIVDKTLDEVQDIFIQSLQFSGGEFSLAPEMFEYVTEGIIKRQLKIYAISIFSNGIIRDNRILESLKKLKAYMKSIEKETNYISDRFNRKYKSCYSRKRVSIVISDVQHKNGKYIEDALAFYNQIKDDVFEIVCQSEHLQEKSQIELDGRALINFKSILPNPVSINNICVPVKEFFIINQEEHSNYRFVEGVILGVAANGNIFLNADPYQNVDRNTMFNIMECHGNFFDKLEKWCWKHPISANARMCIERQRTIAFCKDNNISTIENLEDEFIIMSANVQLINNLETIISNIHKQYPYLYFYECENLAASLLYNRLVNELKQSPKLAHSYLFSITGCKSSVIREFENPYWANNYLLKCKKKHRK